MSRLPLPPGSPLGRIGVWTSETKTRPDTAVRITFLGTKLILFGKFNLVQGSVLLQVHAVVGVDISTLKIKFVLNDLIKLVVVVGRVEVVGTHQVAEVVSVVNIYEDLLQIQHKISLLTNNSFLQHTNLTFHAKKIDIFLIITFFLSEAVKATSGPYLAHEYPSRGVCRAQPLTR